MTTKLMMTIVLATMCLPVSAQLNSGQHSYTGETKVTGGSLLVATQAPKDGPAGTMQTAPLGKILTDIRAAANLVAGDMAVKAMEDGLKTVLGEKGFSGLDLAKPILGYSIYDAKDVNNVAFCLLLPITKEDDFIDFLKRCRLEPEEVKGEKGLYKLGQFDLPVPGADGDEKNYVILARVSGKTVYVGFNLKADQLDPAKCYTAEQILDPKESALFVFKQYMDRVPPEIAKNAMKQYEEMMEKMKKQIGAGEEEAAAMKSLGKLIGAFAKMSEDAKESGVRVTLDTASGELVLDSYYTPKPGTELAKATAARAVPTNAMAAIIGKDTAAGITLQLPVSMKEVQDLIGTGFDKMKEEIKKDPPPPFAKDLVDELIKGAERTVKSGTWDMAVALNGPDKDGHFTAAVATSFEDARPIEKAIKANLKDFPAEFRENVKLDADKVGDVNIHVFDPPERGEPEGYARVFGDRKIYFAFGPKGTYAAVGNAAKDALKTMINGKPVPAKAFDILVNPKKGTQLAAAIEPAAGPIAEKILGTEDKLSSAMSYALEGGESLKFKFAINLKMIPHWVAQGVMMGR